MVPPSAGGGVTAGGVVPSPVDPAGGVVVPVSGAWGVVLSPPSGTVPSDPARGSSVGVGIGVGSGVGGT